MSSYNYLSRFFGHLDQNYVTHGRLLWEVYRNGLIHTYEPKKLQNRTNINYWTLYKGQRTENMNQARITHLVPFRITNNEWTRPVSILCLYDDLIAAIEYNVESMLNNPQLENNIRNVANQLIAPAIVSPFIIKASAAYK